MDAVLFQEKMDPAHRASFCQMLGIKELPECLLVQYVRVKKMTDRVDGHLYVGHLAIIALMAGYNPDSGKFEQTLIEETTEGEDARLQKEADALAAKPPTLDAADDKVVEEAVEAPAEVPKQPPVEQTAPEIGKAMLWAANMPVNVLVDDELKKGKVFAVHAADGDTPIQLTVEVDGGGTITVNEDEVEAI